MNLLVYSAATLWFTVDLALAATPKLSDLVAKGWESAADVLKLIFKQDDKKPANSVAKVSWNEHDSEFQGFNKGETVMTTTEARDLESKFREKIKTAKDASSTEKAVVKLVDKAARCMRYTLALVIDDKSRLTADAAITAAKEEAKDTAACTTTVPPRDVNAAGPPGLQALIEKGWTDAEGILKAMMAGEMTPRWNNEKDQMEFAKGSKVVTLKRETLEAKLIESIKTIPKANTNSPDFMKLVSKASKCVSYSVESAIEDEKQTKDGIMEKAREDKVGFLSCYDKYQDDIR